jgi:glycosyltransferase involved in cell wall biosynthesis
MVDTTGGEIQDELARLRAAVRQEPARAKAWLRLAEGLAAGDDAEEEIQALQKALALGPPDEARVQLLLAVRLGRVGRDEEAIQHLIALAQLSPRPYEAFSRFSKALRRAEPLEAATAIQRRLLALSASRGSDPLVEALYPKSAAPAVASGRSPRVGVGLPVYNDAEHLASALEAVLAQTYANFELTVCDNHSDDGSFEIAQGYARRDSRVRVVRAERNQGAVRNFNLAFELSQGDYYLWASSHDLWAPDYLARLVAALEARPGAVLAFSHFRQVGDDNLVFGFGAPRFEAKGLEGARRLSRAVSSITSAGVMSMGLYRRAALARTPLFHKCVRCDRLLILELAAEGEFVEVPLPLWSRYYDLGQPRVRQQGTERQLAKLFEEGRQAPIANLATLIQCLWLAWDLGPRRALRDPLSIWWGPMAAWLHYRRNLGEARQDWSRFWRTIAPGRR